MNRRGIALLLGLLVVLVLSILSLPFFVKTINESNLVNKYTSSTRAFWLAEAGIAEAIDKLPVLNVSGSIGNSNYTYSAQSSSVSAGYYQIISTGSVLFPGGKSVTKRIEVVLKTGVVNPAKFKYAIETTTSLTIKGSVDINPDDGMKENSPLDFTDLFGYSKTVMRSHATHLYTPSTFVSPVDGITWVDVPAAETLTIAGNLVGSGILIISGNTHFSGTVSFDGIIYVIGKLTMTGDVTATGSVLAESETTVDTLLKGNVTLNYNSNSVANVLSSIQFFTKDIVSW
ncbi:MAG: hypothetical protein HZA27_00230, partial [Candidatus Omnitrophica bacterium]|nr:hypothetical protein [Candidatus Omnitrophota bacterium]